MARLGHIVAAPATPLEPEEWALRHRHVVVLLAAQLVVVAAWAVAAGLPLLHVLLDASPAAAGLLMARSERLPQVARTCGSALGLLGVSAAVVHLADGAFAAHFHYFVMLIVLAQYEDARPFALGIAFVVGQHATIGDLALGEALVHGAFVLAAALVLVINWRTTEALRRREATARRAAQQVLEVAGSVLVALDRDGRVRHANPHAELVVGRPLEGLDWFAEVVPPADYTTARDRFAAHVDGRLPDPQAIETDIVAADGTRRRVAFQIALTRDDHGVVNGSLLAGQDLTAHREAQLALARERDDLALLRRITRDVVGSADPREALVRGTSELIGGGAVVLLERCEEGGLRVTAAHGGARLVGRRLPHAQLPDAPSFLPGPDDDVPPLPREIRVALRTSSAALRPVVVEGRAEGLLVVSWTERRDELDERTDGLLELMADEAAVALGRLALRRRLEAAALADALTGVPNRRAWDEALPRELARARRTGRPFSVAVLDLNDFKLLNDREGHGAGDDALRASAAAWAGELRGTDVLARLGGDEFGVLLPDCPADVARVVAARLREVTPHRAGAGVGTATWDGTEDGSTLVRRADAALYEDKSGAGRSRLTDGGRLAAVRATGLADGARSAELDALAEMVRWALAVPVALVTLVTDERQVFAAHCGLEGSAADEHGTPLSHSFCQHVVARGRPLVIEDARLEPLVRDNPAIADLGVVAYAGMPITDRAGRTLGVLCAIDGRPRDWTADELTTLRQLAVRAADHLAANTAAHAAVAAPAG